ncbi:MAG: alanine--tRNA ligase, partial [Micrococcales bacterium]|nr:alanine--tRNA ligase [Micrococcales bacterium]
ERVAMLLQGKDNIYEIDEIYPVIECAEGLTGLRYGANPEADVRLRVVADHVRAGLMLIGDGVAPSNESRGYVLRRLLRRALFSMRLLGLRRPVFEELFTTSRDAMKASYPELERDWGRIRAAVLGEEEAFLNTLAGGAAVLDLAIAQAKAGGSAKLAGSEAFTLHDTHGFPIELTLEIAADQGLSVDHEKFTSLMAEQKERARADAAAKKAGHTGTAVYQEVAGQHGLTTFTGYDQVESTVRVLALLEDGQPVPAASAPAQVEVILDLTPFYGEAGGQLADKGTIKLDSGAVFEVDDVQKPVTDLFVHRGRLTQGTAAIGDTGLASIDPKRRQAIARAHTATHMVHQSLLEHLGSTATQAGSENSPGRLRFDFRSAGGVPPSVMAQIEEQVNQVLTEDLEVGHQIMSLDKARQIGAQALFGEKYGDQVRVVTIGQDWSVELCGGTHVERIGQIGRVTLLGEASIGAGIRRLEGLVADSAYSYQAKEHALVSQLTDLLKVNPDELTDRVSQLVSRLKQADKELAAIRGQQVLAQASMLAKTAVQVGDIRLLAARVDDGTSGDDLRSLATDVRQRLGEADPVVVAVGATDPETGRAIVVVALNDSARQRGLKAGNLVKQISQQLGGGGGGKDDLAQGGGSQGEGLEQVWAGIGQIIEAG